LGKPKRETIMSWKCDICGKGPSVGHRVSHSDKKSKHVFMPNLQNVRAMVNGKLKKIKACTTCIKSGKVIKA
jgi:large subunit ribosomal protein L28